MHLVPSKEQAVKVLAYPKVGARYVRDNYQRPFDKFLEGQYRLHYWIKASGRRKTIAFWITLWIFLMEVQIHIDGISHMGENSYWWEKIPLLGKLIDKLIQ